MPIELKVFYSSKIAGLYNFSMGYGKGGVGGIGPTHIKISGGGGREDDTRGVLLCWSEIKGDTILGYCGTVG